MDASGLISISGGTLTAHSIEVGRDAPATFTETGGSVDLGAFRVFTIGPFGSATFTGGGFLGTFVNNGQLTVSRRMPLPATGLTQSASGTLTLIDMTPTRNAIFNFSDTPNPFNLDGTLAVRLRPDYLPTQGDVFHIFRVPPRFADYFSVAGQFSTYDLPALPAPLYWQPVYTPTSFSLLVVPEPAPITLLLPLLPIALRRRPAAAPIGSASASRSR